MQLNVPQKKISGSSLFVYSERTNAFGYASNAAIEDWIVVVMCATVHFCQFKCSFCWKKFHVLCFLFAV